MDSIVGRGMALIEDFFVLCMFVCHCLLLPLLLLLQRLLAALFVFFACEDFGRMFDNLFPAFASFFFLFFFLSGD